MDDFEPLDMLTGGPPQDRSLCQKTGLWVNLGRTRLAQTHQHGHLELVM